MKKAGWGYLVVVHVVLLAALVKLDALHRLEVKAGLAPEPDPPFVLEMRESQARLDAAIPAGSILFVGDSNTQAMPVCEISARAVNLGISGERSDQLLVSMENYRSLRRAAAVIVMIGTNDVLHGREPRYGQVLGEVPASVPVFLVSPPPMARIDMQPQAAHSAKACAADSHCTFVDAFSALDGKPGVLREDGVHLSAAGYRVLITLLQQALHRIV